MFSFACTFLWLVIVCQVHIVCSVSLSDQVGRDRCLMNRSKENMVTNDQWVTNPPMSVLVGRKLVPLVVFL